MAQRFGGKYSPNSDAGPGARTVTSGGLSPEFSGKARSRVGLRANLLFALPFPFLISAFRADPVGLALNLACFGALLLAAWLTREGLRAQEAFDARSVAKRPAIPRKIFGSVLTGAGLALAGLADGSVTNTIVFGALGAILHFLSFGPDPLADKGIAGVDAHQSQRVAKAVESAETVLGEMAAAVAPLRDRGLDDRVAAFCATARKMFRTVEQDPRDLTAARKFMGVYLKGARDAAVKFADLYSRKRAPDARDDFIALLDDLDRNFAAKTDTLLLDDRADLTVEVDVLRERLAREGLNT